MKPEKMIDVIQGHIDGKVVQYKHMGVWKKIAFEPKCWDFEDLEYRIKPGPREFYLNLYEKSFSCVHDSLDNANNASYGSEDDLIETIKVIEVIE